MEGFPERKRELPKEEVQDAQIGLLEWELEERDRQHALELENTNEQHGIEPLTGTRRREVLLHELDQALKKVRGEIQEHREGVEPLEKISLVFIDLDKFKQVNDTRGHAAGDAVLITVAELLRKELREMDILARYGGDEFVVLLPNTDEKGAMIVAEKLRAALDNDPDLKEVGVTASFGVVSSTVSTADNPGDFIKHADEAAYISKRAGGNRVEVYT